MLPAPSQQPGESVPDEMLESMTPRTRSAVVVAEVCALFHACRKVSSFVATAEKLTSLRQYLPAFEFFSNPSSSSLTIPASRCHRTPAVEVEELRSSTPSATG